MPYMPEITQSNVMDTLQIVGLMILWVAFVYTTSHIWTVWRASKARITTTGRFTSNSTIGEFHDKR